jgi:hypothetical protein
MNKTHFILNLYFLLIIMFNLLYLIKNNTSKLCINFIFFSFNLLVLYNLFNLFNYLILNISSLNIFNLNNFYYFLVVIFIIFLILYIFLYLFIIIYINIFYLLNTKYNEKLFKNRKLYIYLFSNIIRNYILHENKIIYITYYFIITTMNLRYISLTRTFLVPIELLFSVNIPVIIIETEDIIYLGGKKDIKDLIIPSKIKQGSVLTQKLPFLKRTTLLQNKSIIVENPLELNKNINESQKNIQYIDNFKRELELPKPNSLSLPDQYIRYNNMTFNER